MARGALFDLAVNRALAFARRTRALERTTGVSELAHELEPWVLQTRFAYRLDLSDVAERLRRAPEGEVHWSGGLEGSWRPGAPPRP